MKRRHILAEAAVFVALALFIYTLYVACHAASGQTTQPVEHPRAAQLREAAADFQSLHNEAVDLAERLTREQIAHRQAAAELEALKSAVAGLPLWTPATVIEAGKTYLLPAGAAVGIDVTVPNVTLIGGHVWPIPGRSLPAIYARDNGHDLTVIGTRFDYPDFPASGDPKLGPCVRTLCRGTVVKGTTSGNIDTMLEHWPGAVGTHLIGHVAGAGLRGSLSYGQGDDTYIVGCRVEDGSSGENVIRWSPRNGVVGRGCYVIGCYVRQRINKACIDFRHMVDGYAIGNTFETSEYGVAIGVGRSDALPGAENVRIVGNRFVRGRLHVHQCRGLVYEDNRVEYPTQGEDHCVYVGHTTGFRVRNNRGPLPAPGQKWNTRKGEWEPINPKPLIGYGANVTGVDDDGTSAWTLPAPVTAPPAAN